MALRASGIASMPTVMILGFPAARAASAAATAISSLAQKIAPRSGYRVRTSVAISAALLRSQFALRDATMSRPEILLRLILELDHDALLPGVIPGAPSMISTLPFGIFLAT